jgi:hypothetical protein
MIPEVIVQYTVINLANSSTALNNKKCFEELLDLPSKS